MTGEDVAVGGCDTWVGDGVGLAVAVGVGVLSSEALVASGLAV